MQDRLPARCLGETRCAGERALRWPDCSGLGLALIRVGLPERDSRQGCNGLTRRDMLASSPAIPWWPPPCPSCLANTRPEVRLTGTVNSKFSMASQAPISYATHPFALVLELVRLK